MTVEIDVTNPEYELVWPRAIFVAELTNLIRNQGEVSTDDYAWFLEEALNGDTPSGDLRAQANRGWVTWGTPSSQSAEKDFMQALLGQAGSLGTPTQRAPYWHERHGAVEAKAKSGNFSEEWTRIINDFADRGYFAKIAPDPCVDADQGPEDDGEEARNMERAILRTSGLEVNWWHVRAGTASLDEDTLYGLVECLFTLIARPRRRWYHSYANCGWHHANFYRPTGQALYAWKVNESFEQVGIPLALETSRGELHGRLIRVVGAPYQDLFKTAPRSPDESIRGRINHAIDLYKKRGATEHDKRSACKNLADILELRKKTVLEKELPSKDRSDLFQIANKFGIRHMDAGQRLEYDPAFLDWIFLSYLNTINLTEDLIERRAAPQEAERWQG